MEWLTRSRGPVGMLLPVGDARFNLLDLFSGIGGFSLGLERSLGFKTVAFCEIEPFPRRVLAKHWSEVPCYDDIRTLTAARLAADGITVDAICGGFPCQDISNAGLRAGIEGERSGLWSEYARLIGEIRPRYVFVENVAALLGRGIGRVLGDLSALGYDAEWHCIPASSIGAPHIRDRLWVVAYPKQRKRVHPILNADNEPARKWRDKTIRRSDRIRHEMGSTVPALSYQWLDQPDPTRMVDGVPDWPHRLAAIGNAVVPQIPEILGRAVMAYERDHG